MIHLLSALFIVALFQTGDVIPMPVPSSYNDITQDKALRDFIGWVWYDKEVYAPKTWKSDQIRVVLRFESAHYNTIVVGYNCCDYMYRKTLLQSIYTGI